MTAEIVSIGTELLLGQIADTDAQYLGEMLAELGIDHTHRQTVGDNLPRIVEALRLAMSRVDVVLTIGGLGPTEDDLTRQAIAEALDDALVEDPKVADRLRKLFAYRNLAWTDSQARQSMRPTCGRPVENPNGTAPGLICEKGGKAVIAMPGPRLEFEPMANGPVREYLSQRSGGVIFSRILRIAGIGESKVEGMLGELMRGESPTLAPYAKLGEVHLRLTVRADSPEAAQTIVGPIEERIRAILGDSVYGADDTSLEAAVLEMLRARGQTLAVAESCTGGLLGGRITNVAGSSDAFLGGVIAYSNPLKIEALGVLRSTLDAHGAVSEQAVREMADGARSRLRADWGLSITGIAGPGGGSPTKPVGLVFVGCAGPHGTTAEEHRFRGSRETVRLRAVHVALIRLRSAILGAP